jgi:hypothetical protein
MTIVDVSIDLLNRTWASLFMGIVSAPGHAHGNHYAAAIFPLAEDKPANASDFK